MVEINERNRCQKRLKKKLMSTRTNISYMQSFKTRTGSAGRPGSGRPGPGTGPGGGKNLLWSWPGKTRSTRRVDPGPGPPGQTRVRPGQFYFIC